MPKSENNLASISIKVNRSMKEKADVLLNSFGISLTTAINIFLRQMIKEEAIPFRIQEVKTNDDEIDLEFQNIPDEEW